MSQPGTSIHSDPELDALLLEGVNLDGEELDKEALFRYIQEKMGQGDTEHAAYEMYVEEWFEEQKKNSELLYKNSCKLLHDTVNEAINEGVDTKTATGFMFEQQSEIFEMRKAQIASLDAKKKNS